MFKHRKRGVDRLVILRHVREISFTWCTVLKWLQAEYVYGILRTHFHGRLFLYSCSVHSSFIQSFIHSLREKVMKTGFLKSEATQIRHRR